jgi:hypothetical protein
LAAACSALLTLGAGSADAYPDYRRLIKTPIDISTIYSRVLSDHYPTFQSLAEDVGLVFTNCYSYNAKVCRLNRLPGLGV